MAAESPGFSPQGGSTVMRRERYAVKSLAFLKYVAHDRKTAMYAAEREGKTRNFAYGEELEASHETLAQLIQRVQTASKGFAQYGPLWEVNVE